MADFGKLSLSCLGYLRCFVLVGRQKSTAYDLNINKFRSKSESAFRLPFNLPNVEPNLTKTGKSAVFALRAHDEKRLKNWVRSKDGIFNDPLGYPTNFSS